MVVSVRFASLTGKFAFVKTERFADFTAAKAAIVAYATASGYSNVKTVNDYESDHVRFTATTPGGRSGRNIAFLDELYDDEF